MSSPSSPSASPAVTLTPPQSTPSPSPSHKPQVYTVGTLRYDRRQLMVLFFWLMWNDFGIMLLEQIGALNGVLMKDHGATFANMSVLGSIGGVFTIWINPVVSTWSDRHRGPLGRRRPFLLFATPPFALFLALTPFMPDIYHYLSRFSLVSKCAALTAMPGPVFLIGVCGVVSGMFNAVVLAIFSYLYCDVVPESHMGRFQSLSKNVSLIAGLVWSFFIFGLADHHMKSVYVGTAAFSLLIYIFSVCKIKEGEYPPPNASQKGGTFIPVRTYFVECFSHSYFLWVFIAMCFFQIANIGNSYTFFFLHYDLKLDLATIGWADGWSKSISTIFGLIAGFAIGSLTDRLKPVRLIGPSVALYGLLRLASFFFVHDQWTCLVSGSLIGMIVFVYNVILGAFTIEIFPREKFGQFCSAQAVFYGFTITAIGPLTGMFFDYIHFNQFSYIWSAIFYACSAGAYTKVYFNWRKRLQAAVPANNNVILSAEEMT